MGQTLSSPVTIKNSESGEDDRYFYGVSEMQGWRISMEDAHTTVLNIDDSEVEKNAFFAVFDGHGGAAIAKFAGSNVWRRLASEEAYREKRYGEALKKAFLGTDEDIRSDEAFHNDPSGCTAVAALVTPDKIYVANAGDSRSILSAKGEAKPLSFDHKPMNESETSRITAAGGFIEFGRVNGNLALSRAIGDFEFKKNYALPPERQIITADPDVIPHDITEEDEFLVLACDGIWDCLSSQQVIDIIRRLIYEGKEMTEICDKIIDICLAPDSTSHNGIGCDNMTIMVVALLHGRTKEGWYAWMKDRVEHRYGYDTPEQFPQIYTPSTSRQNPGAGLQLRLGPGGLNSLARALGGFDAIRFGQDDSEEDSGEDEASESSFLGSLRAPPQRDPTLTLRNQLEELEEYKLHDEDANMTPKFGGNDDEDIEMENADSTHNNRVTIEKNLGSLVDKNLRQEISTTQSGSKPPSNDSKGSIGVEGLLGQ